MERVANLPYLPAADAHRHPDLRLEPAKAVFASGDGLDPYRRLLEASSRRLTTAGKLAIQLPGRIEVAASAELPALETALEGRTGRVAEPRVPALAGAAA